MTNGETRKLTSSEFKKLKKRKKVIKWVTAAVVTFTVTTTVTYFVAESLLAPSAEKVHRVPRAVSRAHSTAD